MTDKFDRRAARQLRRAQKAAPLFTRAGIFDPLVTGQRVPVSAEELRARAPSEALAAEAARRWRERLNRNFERRCVVALLRLRREFPATLRAVYRLHPKWRRTNIQPRWSRAYFWRCLLLQLRQLESGRRVVHGGPLQPPPRWSDLAW